ncbi:DUF2637 domain-containing protein [Dactylosporangium sp. NPDC051484]|uniref:DUF2637 domain-containing protein n=1 Tax=Dactylosporangium sp. NPDC051484 TaxID=3154942 RepID=UPI00344CA035
MSANPARSRTQRALQFIGAAVVVVGIVGVAVAAFALSYDAIRSVGIAANIRESWAWMLPVSIDGAMAVATVAVLLLKHLRKPTGWPWFVAAVGFVVSAGCNALHAQLHGGRKPLPDEFAVAVSVVPPLMLLLSVELLAVLTKTLGMRGSEQSTEQKTEQKAEQVPAGGPNRSPRTGEQTALLVPPVRPDRGRADLSARTEQVASRNLTAGIEQVPDRNLFARPEPVEQTRSDARTGLAEQANRPEPARPVSSLPTGSEQARDLPEQTEQIAEQAGPVAEQTGGHARGQNAEQVELLGGEQTEQTDGGRTGQSEQVDTEQTEQTEQVGSEQTEEQTEQTGGQNGEQRTEQVDERPRPDDELIAILREQAAEQIADRSLSRYRVEKLTGASSRQAGRLLDVVLTAEQSSGQTALAAASR